MICDVPNRWQIETKRLSPVAKVIFILVVGYHEKAATKNSKRMYMKERHANDMPGASNQDVFAK